MRDAARRLASAEGIGPVTSDRPLGEVLEFLRTLWGLNHALESASRRMRARFGVTGPERMVVRLAGRYPGISAGDLARILRVHPSTLTGLLKRLVARGILTRRADAADSRRALFALTSEGASIDGVRKGTVEAVLTAALAGMPPREVRAAATVLERLTRTLEG
jgi:MarR family transcriptional regulator, organic hydroperoxide resistance regulator